MRMTLTKASTRFRNQCMILIICDAAICGYADTRCQSGSRSPIAALAIELKKTAMMADVELGALDIAYVGSRPVASDLLAASEAFWYCSLGIWTDLSPPRFGALMKFPCRIWSELPSFGSDR